MVKCMVFPDNLVIFKGWTVVEVLKGAFIIDHKGVLYTLVDFKDPTYTAYFTGPTL